MSAGSPHPEDVAKISQLSSINPDSIFSLLRDRFFSSLPYTALSDSILVSVNPYASSGNRNSDDTLREYTRNYRETSKQARGPDLPPHIFGLACDAYFYMRRTGQDQSILLAGDTASGKSELRRLAVRTLIDLSVTAPGKKGSKLGVQIPSAEYVLESFGNSGTLENRNASRFGKYTELQFSEQGRLMGAKTLDYYLERNRVVSAAGGERNFHVFYYMVSGASDEEKEYLGTGDGSGFRYLGQASRHKDAVHEDALRFGRLKQAFKNVGFSKRHVASICQVLAAILHLGNIEFHYDRHHTQDSASVRNADVLERAADFLGIPAKALEEALTYKTKMIKNEVCTILLDADGASNHRDDLAKSLYSLLFAWINESLNEKFCRDDFDTFVGILDLPGFQNLSRGNSLDQFCVNFACESLHRYLLRSVFERNRDEYADEGITYLSPDIPYFDNAECLRLMTNQPGGLTHIMDDQARRMPKKTDHTMIEAFGKRWGNHPSFKVGPADRSGFSSFTISHYHSAVTYTSENLLERNSEVVSPDFVSLLRGSGGDGAGGKGGFASDPNASPGSKVPFMYAPSRNMFADAAGGKAGGAGGNGLYNEKGGATAFTEEPSGEVAEEVQTTSARRKWVALTWLLTFWVPTPLLNWIGGLRRPDIRMAWREKLAINMMIWFICGCAVFVIVVLGNLICPKEHVLTQNEFRSHIGDNSYTAIRGEVFDLSEITAMHRSIVSVVPDDSILRYAGYDATPIFPVQVNALCNGVTGSVSPWVQLSNDNATDKNAQYHDFRTFHTDDARPDWYYQTMWLLRSNYRRGFLGYTSDGIRDLLEDKRSVAVYRGGIYDVTDYVKQGNQGALRAPDGQQAPAGTNLKFMSDPIISLITQNPGKDITKQLDSLPLPADVLERQRVCLRNLYFIGKVDHRNSAKCKFSQYILLALSLVMVAILGFKFLAALQFGRARKPEDHDKFVICQVPCYTEGEESMRKTIDSLAALKYDDKRKLIFVICDGNIVGSGNDRPTPRIVLDILGADPNLEPEALSFLSLGEGSKQHNMAKVYSGLYEHLGHVVPYIVVVKCGKPTERSRPGNRGKRDSQLVLMRFLNKVHFGLPMNPMELEIYHQIKNVIGVNPSFYEYILQVDADTEVDSLSLNRFISAFIRDKKVIGLCGETALSNAKASFVTMLQVYEYYISHYLAKAFESLFGSVTCLPGCFSMFRIRTPDTHRPLFIASAIVEEYSENRVDTLHTKNLLHLGEDRYLTTLVLKHFGKYKTIFVRDCKAYTVAPDDWKVLLSQRRRWINSTVHNLVELIFTPGLCGFCLFSMRFIVFIDLLSTVIAPVTVAYIAYLIVLVATDNGTIPLTAIIMLAAIYGCQALIFLLNRKFEMIGWMIVYIIGIPIWSLFLPLYSFWHMDDFSWGNTRVVMGEKGQKVVVHDEGKFDASDIPLQTWTEYENELWERNSARSIGSIIEAARNESKSLVGGGGGPGTGAGSRAGSAYAPSLYGAPMLPHNGSFGHSPTPSQYGGTPSIVAAPAYGFPQPDMARQSTYSIGGMGGGGNGGGYATPAMSTYGGPASTYGMPVGGGFMAPQGQFGSGASIYGGFPGQQQQMYPQAAASLIAESDLTTITKKQLRAKLEQRYGTSIDAKKAFINAQIEATLSEA
ncbi:uncharacterized protein PFL1_06595 [Pseudozyma flocculosa PF-1]|uniref:chitin synthase n=1 Tax=Pseudozyma flocculosa PF-1 TaxID=1277687 RepID=A0A061H5Q9_9BASI|nr:uncharacterized protein PFL1_06595 [Pseudozyma flocculosa PF-1]EPQ25921.1 hypothetical protein PFL1_06595 [Pseudozyma flocculosa PF-1]